MGRTEASRRQRDRRNAREALEKVQARLFRMAQTKASRENRAGIFNVLDDLNGIARTFSGIDLKGENENNDRFVLRYRVQQMFEEAKGQMRLDSFDETTMERIKTLDNKLWDELTLQDAQNLTLILRNLETEIRNSQRLLTESQLARNHGVELSVYQLQTRAESSIRESRGIDRTSRAGDLHAWLDKTFINPTLSPERFFHRLTGYDENSPLYRLVQDLIDGQRNAQKYEMEAQRAFDQFLNSEAAQRKDSQGRTFLERFSGKKANEIEITGYGRKYEGKNRDKSKGKNPYRDRAQEENQTALKNIYGNMLPTLNENQTAMKGEGKGRNSDVSSRGKFADGMVTVKITPAMRTALYLHWQNGEHNLRHIEKGGINVPDMRLYKAWYLPHPHPTD